MVRVTMGAPRRRKKNRYFKQAKGFRGGRSKLWRTVRETLLRAWAFSQRDRRAKKRTFRALWQIRINAAARAAGMTYSRFVEGLKAAKVALDRKVIADLAATDAAAFAELVRVAQGALVSKRSAVTVKA